MVDFLYIAFIYPVEMVMLFCFEKIQDFTDNYGVSIGLLSLLVNIIITPLYLFAEKRRRLDSEKKAPMFSEINKIKKVYSGEERHLYILAIYRRYNYSPLFNLEIPIGILVQIPFFIAAFHLLSNYDSLKGVGFGPLSNLADPDGIAWGYNLLPFLMTVFNVGSVLSIGKNRNWIGKTQLIGLALLFMAVLYDQSAGLLLYWTVSNLFVLLKEPLIQKLNVDFFKGKYPAVALMGKIFGDPTKKFSNRFVFFKKKSPTFSVFILAFFPFLFLILVVNPLVLFNSAPADFLVGGYAIFKTSMVLLLLSLVGVSCVYLVVGRLIKHMLTVFGFFLLFCSVIYSFLLQGEYGVMDHFIFINPTKLLSSNYLIAIELLGLIFLLTVLVYIYNSHIRHLKYIVVWLIVSFSIYIIANVPFNDESVSTSQFSSELGTTMALSKRKNVLVIMLDGFSGGDFRNLFKFKPNVLEHFKGFVWYRNTLSIGTRSTASIPAVTGGHGYSISAMNSRVNTTIQEDVNEAYAVYPKAFLAENWDVAYYNPQYATEIVEGVHDSKFDYREYYFTTENITSIPQGPLHFRLLQIISIFRSVPFFLKDKVYSKGTWLGVFEDKRRLSSLIYAKARDWGFLKAFHKFINFDNPKKTFKYFQFSIPHRPNIIGFDGSMGKETNPQIESFVVVQKLGRIFEKLAKNGVYDKTKIIIFSDHGLFDRPHNDFSPTFSEKIKPGFEGRMAASRVNPLLLVKDFNSHGPMTKSDRFLSNADVPSIACSALREGCHIKDRDPIKVAFKRTLSITTHANLFNFRSDTLFKIIEKYKVKDNVFDENNWKRVK